MTTVHDVLEYMETIAPSYMKEDWDRVGLNCGNRDRQVKKILVALDPFDEVCREALEIGADLLVTHHALIWEPGFVTGDTAQGARTLFLIENGIAHCNAHTNLDKAPGGVNDVLARMLGLSDIAVIEPDGQTARGTPYGLLRCGQVAEQSLDSFLQLVKSRLGTPVLRFSRGGDTVSRVAVGGGACAGALSSVIAAGCDTFVTSDVKYNQFWDARNEGITLIDAGHFYTENPVVSVLATALSRTFPEVEVKVSEYHRDCMEFV